MADNVSNIAFTASVKAEQERRGSRTGYARKAEKRDWQTVVTDDLATFLAERDSAYLATATADGQPYVQHRGGPKGFLKVLDERRLAFADFGGNRQYITLGNLADNDNACLFLMDYANRRRVKVWGRARVVEDDPALLERLVDPGYDAKPERAIVFTIAAWDVNCPQHIVRRFDEATVTRINRKLLDRVAELEAEVDRLRVELAAARK